MVRDRLRRVILKAVAVEPVRSRLRFIGEVIMAATEEPVPTNPLDDLIWEHRRLKQNLSLFVYARNFTLERVEDGDESQRERLEWLTPTVEDMKAKLIALQVRIEEARGQAKAAEVDTLLATAGGSNRGRAA